MFRFVLVAALLLLGPAHAQNTSGVFGPKVTRGTKTFEYRYAVAEPLRNAPDERWSQRIHYQQAFTDRLAGRIGVEWQDAPMRDEAEFAFVRAMLFVELGRLTEAWTTGLRLDARARNGDRPDDLAVNWTNQFDLGPKSFVRFNVLTSHQIGDRAADNPIVELRSSIFRSLDSGHSVGLELYDRLGEWDTFGEFDEQRHEVAPVVTFPLPGPYSLYTSVGFGLSEPAPDNSFRMRLIRKF